METRTDMAQPGGGGRWERLVGPGTTRTENALILGFAVVVTGSVIAYGLVQNLGWDLFQIAVVVVFGLDIAGGIIANSTVPGSRWWHRPEQTDWSHVRFVALHVHPFVVAATFPEWTWMEAAIGYAFLVLAMGFVLGASRRLKRPVAIGVFAAGIGVALYAVTPPVGLEWFLPLLYLKLIPGHLVPPD